MKSWKMGAIAGLIAGIVYSISFTILAIKAASLGFWNPYYRPLVSNSIGINIFFGIIFGIILGVIYSKAHDLIPCKGYSKGLCFGLIIFIIYSIRMDTFSLAYGYHLAIAGNIFSTTFSWLAYGLVLGILYKIFLNRYPPSKKGLKIKTYDIKDGFYPGAFAGFSGGMAASIVAILGPAIGLWGITSGPKKLTFDFWMSQAGTHLFVNMLWGIVFGVIFAKVYNLVPGKNIAKGLYYGLILYLITTFQYSIYWATLAAYNNLTRLAMEMIGFTLIVGFFQFLFFGLVLGLIYRKPPK